MFNIGPSEMFMLGLMILLLFGPSRLPEIARAAGKGLRAFRQAANDIQREVKEAVEAEEKAGRSPEAEEESKRSTPEPEPQPPPDGVPMTPVDEPAEEINTEESSADESPEVPPEVSESKQIIQEEAAVTVKES